MRRILPLFAGLRFSIALGIFAILCGLAAAKLTYIQISNLENPSFGGIGGESQNNSPKEDKTVTDGDGNSQSRQDTALTSRTDEGGRFNRHKEMNPSWEAVARVLAATTPFVPETVEYGEHTFVCEARSPNFNKLQVRWKGKCTDEKTGRIAVCKGCLSPTTSVKRAAAQLVRDMVKLGEYPQPSNTGEMPVKCECPINYPSAVRRMLEYIQSASQMVVLIFSYLVCIFVCLSVCFCVYLLVGLSSSYVDALFRWD